MPTPRKTSTPGKSSAGKARGATRRTSKADVPALLAQVLAALGRQQALIERLLDQQAGPRPEGVSPSDPSDTVGAIPRITLVPERAA